MEFVIAKNKQFSASAEYCSCFDLSLSFSREANLHFVSQRYLQLLSQFWWGNYSKFKATSVFFATLEGFCSPSYLR